MKKILSAVFAAVLSLSLLTACGGSKGITIAVPNDTTNEARALLLLEKNGYIKLKSGAGITATITDAVKALKAALESKKVKDFITEKYNGAVVSTVDNPGDGYDASVDYAALAGKKITVAASPTPHAEILKIAKDILAEKNVTIEVKEFTDYVQPNNVVESGEVDANYFQHFPYLDDFNKENGTHIVSIGAIHVEPIALYAGKQTSLDAIKAAK